jgi:hypothetical protein
MATYGFVWGFLWLAQLVNEAIAEIAAQLARGWRHLFPVSGSSAVTGLPSAVVKAMLVIFVVGVLLLMQSCATTEPVGVVHASAIQETTSLPVHDNAAPYTAWVLCVDTSTSVRDDQFTKLQAILEQTLQSKLKNNDIVWLVDMGSAKSLAQSIYVPALPRQQGPRPLDAVSRQAAERALAAAIDEIRRAIQSLERSAVNTNLIDRIALAMGILRDHPSATKVLLIGSDFIDDRGVPTATPPSNSLGLSGKGVYALLFAARPTTRALKDIGLSEVRLEQVVRTEWSAYFKSLNAQAVSVQLADSIPTSPNLGN